MFILIYIRKKHTCLFSQILLFKVNLKYIESLNFEVRKQVNSSIRGMYAVLINTVKVNVIQIQETSCKTCKLFGTSGPNGPSVYITSRRNIYR